MITRWPIFAASVPPKKEIVPLRSDWLPWWIWPFSNQNPSHVTFQLKHAFFCDECSRCISQVQKKKHFVDSKQWVNYINTHKLVILEKRTCSISFVFVMASFLHCGQGAHGELLGDVMRWCRAARIWHLQTVHVVMPRLIWPGQRICYWRSLTLPLYWKHHMHIIHCGIYTI